MKPKEVEEGGWGGEGGKEGGEVTVEIEQRKRERESAKPK